MTFSFTPMKNMNPAYGPKIFGSDSNFPLVFKRELKLLALLHLYNLVLVLVLWQFS